MHGKCSYRSNNCANVQLIPCMLNVVIDLIIAPIYNWFGDSTTIHAPHNIQGAEAEFREGGYYLISDAVKKLIIKGHRTKKC